MKRVLPLLFLAMSLPLFAQTSTTYTAYTGTVSSYNQVYAYLSGGGDFDSPWGMGGGCYYGSCPAWPFTNYPLSYALPDGSTASFTNFTGTADFVNQYDVTAKGTASGVDSTGASVSVSVSWAFKAVCRSGRGGGCTKYFLGGSLTVTK